MAKKRAKKGAVRRYAVLFGFDMNDKDRTGYLKVGETGCAVVDSRRDATEFSLSAEPGKGTPKDWCEFFKAEPGVSDWRFHPVQIMEKLS